jgi:hypothetical protein
MSTDTAPHKTIHERQRDAALAQVAEWRAEKRRVAEIVLGPNPPIRRHLSEVIKLGDDYLIQVRDGNEPPTWTTVVNGKRSIWLFPTQEEALLHLIARRGDDDENTSANAAHYAGRVLGLPEAKQ